MDFPKSLVPAGTLPAWVAFAALAAVAAPLHAQTVVPRPVTPVNPASGPAPNAAISDRARRDAESPLYWIRVHAERTPDERKAAAAVRSDSGTKATVLPTAAPAQAANTGPAGLAAAAAGGAVGRSPPSPSPTGSRPATAATESAVAPLTGPSTGPAEAMQKAAALKAPASANPSASADDAGGAPEKPVAGAAVGSAAVPEQRVASLTPPAAPAPPPPSPPTEPAAAAEALVMLSGSEPRFPEALMRRLRKGAVTMRVEVGSDGQVLRTSVLSSSNPRLEAAATEAAQAMRFQPVRRPASADINFSFDLDL